MVFSGIVWIFLKVVVVVRPQSDHHTGAETHTRVHTSLVSVLLFSTFIFCFTITLPSVWLDDSFSVSTLKSSFNFGAIASSCVPLLNWVVIDVMHGRVQSNYVVGRKRGCNFLKPTISQCSLSRQGALVDVRAFRWTRNPTLSLVTQLQLLSSL